MKTSISSSTFLMTFLSGDGAFFLRMALGSYPEKSNLALLISDPKGVMIYAPALAALYLADILLTFIGLAFD